jgi:hypothetical protein
MPDDDDVRSAFPERPARTSRELIARDRALIRQVLAATRALSGESAHASAPSRWLVCLTEARRAAILEEAETRQA